MSAVGESSTADTFKVPTRPAWSHRRLERRELAGPPGRWEVAAQGRVRRQVSVLWVRSGAAAPQRRFNQDTIGFDSVHRPRWRRFWAVKRSQQRGSCRDGHRGSAVENRGIRLTENTLHFTQRRLKLKKTRRIHTPNRPGPPRGGLSVEPAADLPSSRSLVQLESKWFLLLSPLTSAILDNWLVRLTSRPFPFFRQLKFTRAHAGPGKNSDTRARPRSHSNARAVYSFKLSLFYPQSSSLYRRSHTCFIWIFKLL